jgi:hypothetical protein
MREGNASLVGFRRTDARLLAQSAFYTFLRLTDYGVQPGSPDEKGKLPSSRDCHEDFQPGICELSSCEPLTPDPSPSRGEGRTQPRDGA